MLGDREPCTADQGCMFCTVGLVALLFTLIHVSGAKHLQGISPNKVALSLKGLPVLIFITRMICVWSTSRPLIYVHSLYSTQVFGSKH